ncbi:unnamed protein product [Clonostachys byssicola]|uniref:Uncharacterized protein n=1 Tax=Clonostachys byssicola TaxID=160290 RepID=A0A9N9UEY9_9HYPO|nr:unnamed protein product [Clonostachys byssicola]
MDNHVTFKGSYPIADFSSLEGVEPILGTDQRTDAKRRLYHIVEHFEAASSRRSNGDYSCPRLVHPIYDYALSEESRDNFLQAFSRAMALSIDGSEEDGVQGGDAEAVVGTTDRLAALRGACLIRDRHRCVISRKFDLGEADKRMERDGDDARDDDGV